MSEPRGHLVAQRIQELRQRWSGLELVAIEVIARTKARRASFRAVGLVRGLVQRQAADGFEQLGFLFGCQKPRLVDEPTGE